MNGEASHETAKLRAVTSVESRRQLGSAAMLERCRCSDEDRNGVTQVTGKMRSSVGRHRGAGCLQELRDEQTMR